MSHKTVLKDLKAIGNTDIAEHSRRFFKTGPGEYAEGDQFLGIRVPEIRKLAGRFKQLPLKETENLLHSEYHEARLCALVILVNRFKKENEQMREAIYQLYLNNTRFINNWDLVDTSAEHIVGAYLLNREKDRTLLPNLAESDNLWERRIAIMSTFHFIKHGDFEYTLILSEKLLNDKHDLIHKAVGWMLREIGKRDLKKEEQFLQEHISNMPRTTLRYAIEKFPEPKRKKYLAM